MFLCVFTAVQDELDALWRLLTLCAVCMMVIGHFAGWHLYYCIFKGMTTIEVYRALATSRNAGINSVESPFSWGTFWSNWRRYFGDRSVVRTLFVPAKMEPLWPPFPCPLLREFDASAAGLV